jgi:PEP-CTERM motif
VQRRKTVVLSLLFGIVLLVCATPAWAGRISQGGSGLGNSSCEDALGTDGLGNPNTINQQPFVVVHPTFVEASGSFTSCSPFDGTFVTIWDLFHVSVGAGDTIDLAVNDSTKNWGIFDDTGFNSSNNDCGSDLLSLLFTTCFDPGPGESIFGDPTIPNVNDFPVDVSFYTSPGALKFLSITHPEGIEQVLYGEKGEAAVPEPGSVWLLCAAVLMMAGAGWRRKHALAAAERRPSTR